MSNGIAEINPIPGQDCYAQVQALINAGTSREMVFVADGTGVPFQLSQPLRVPNNRDICIRGVGLPRLQLIGGDSLIRFTNGGPMHGKTTRISGLILDANNRPNSHAIDTEIGNGNVDFDNLIIDDCRILGTTHYDIYFPNLDYCIAPKFRDLRGVHGIYIAGAVHTSSNLEISGCRWHNQYQVGPLINLWGCRKFIIRDNITEGGSAFGPDVDVDADDVQNTVGILIRNPGPRGGIIDNNWFEFWGTYSNAAVKHLTIDYTFNTGGAQQCSRYKVINTNCTRVAFKNSSTTDTLEIDLEPNELFLPDTTNENVFAVKGRTVVYASGRIQKSDAPRHKSIRLSKSMSLGAAYRAFHYQDTPTEIYEYQGGTGVYRADVLAGGWTNCRPYVQHHPKHGHSIVWKKINSLSTGGHGTFRVPVVVGQELYQRMLVASPHLLATTGQSEIVINNQNISIHGLCRNFGSFVDSHAPRLVEAVGDSGEASLQVSNLHPQAKWVQLFAASASVATFDRLAATPYNYDCFEWPNDPGPPLGTSIIGDLCRSLDGSTRWTCTKAGTSRPIAVDADFVFGSNQLRNCSDLTELLVGDYLLMEGVEYRIMNIGTDTATLHRNALVTGRFQAVNSNPVWSN